MRLLNKWIDTSLNIHKYKPWRDNKPVLSVETRFSQNDWRRLLEDDDQWSAPLPIRSPRPRLPDNRPLRNLEESETVCLIYGKNFRKWTLKLYFLKFSLKIVVDDVLNYVFHLLQYRASNTVVGVGFIRIILRIKTL